MGLLDQLLGSFMGGGSPSPIQGTLMNMLRGGQQNSTMGNQSQSGGLGGLLSSFQQAGLGHIAQSWIGNGPNQSVSPQQLQTVFGDNQVQGMASQAGMGAPDFLSQLSQHLPNVVNGMTPDGRLPDEGSMSV